jgi:alkylhydroperoxidase family enzyme
VDIGSAVSEAMGVSEEKLRALSGWRDSEAFSDLEKAAIEYAECLTRTPADVPDELFERLRAELDEPQLVELTATIAWENYVGRFNRGLDVTSDNYTPEGAFCLLPDRGPGGSPSP